MKVVDYCLLGFCALVCVGFMVYGITMEATADSFYRDVCFANGGVPNLIKDQPDMCLLENGLYLRMVR